MSYTGKLNAKKMFAVCYFVGGEKQQPRYAYVCLRLDLVDALYKDIATGKWRPEHYGHVILQGVGEANEEEKAAMRRDYGFNHYSPFVLGDAPDAPVPPENCFYDPDGNTCHLDESGTVHTFNPAQQQWVPNAPNA